MLLSSAQAPLQRNAMLVGVPLLVRQLKQSRIGPMNMRGMSCEASAGGALLDRVLSKSTWVVDSHQGFDAVTDGVSANVSFEAPRKRLSSVREGHVRAFVTRKMRAMAEDEEVCSQVVDAALSSLKTLPSSMSVRVIPEVVSEEEETAIVEAFDERLQRKAYEAAHWDHVIAGYRELEVPRPEGVLREVSERVKRLVFREQVRVQAPHLLDISEMGHMRPHVDHVSYGGGVICSLNLLSPAVITLQPDILQLLPPEEMPENTVTRMKTVGGNAPAVQERLQELATLHGLELDDQGNPVKRRGRSLSVQEQQLYLTVLQEQLGIDASSSEKSMWDSNTPLPLEESVSVFDDELPRVELMLQPRALYVLCNEARYTWTHGIEKPCAHSFQGDAVTRTRRISVMFRDPPARQPSSRQAVTL